MMNLLAIVCPILMWTVTSQRGSALLTIRQGRTASDGSHSVISIIGIATVELGGNPANQPTYYFECITTRNNGSGVRWSRMSALNRFQVVNIPDGSPGKRLDVAGISYPDLDIYTCSDRYSNDVASVNITAFNPAIMAAEETVGVVEGLSVQLEVYVSGHPTPSSSHITWYNPEGGEISDSGGFGVRFLDSKRRLVLSNVQSQQAGVYRCDVVISIIPYMGTSTEIQLEVYVPPTFMSQPGETLDAAEWTEVTLNCSASGSPTPLIRWERESGAQLPVGALTSSSTNGSKVTSMLTLDMVRYEDRGRYRCVADNIETNPVVSQNADIRVTPALRLTDERMRPVSDLYSVDNGAQVRLECFGTGNLQWTSSTGLEIPSDRSGNIYRSYDHTRDALTLVIQNFTNNTIATYTCVTDLTDAHDSPITISVLITSYNPAVIIQSQVQYVLPDSSTTLEARVFASPLDQAVVQWYHQGRLIDDDTEIPYTASSSGDLHRLTVDSVSENELGEYSIVVSLNGLRASDRTTLFFPDSPSATISPSSITVSEGDEVRLTCEAEGSAPLTVTWTMSDGSPLPVGVQENGNTLLIVSATSTHPGTYVCSVSNLAGADQDEVLLIVFYSPKAVISYNGTLSTPGEQLYLTFDDGAPGPTITCSAGGHLTPTVEWIKDNARGLPHGIVQLSSHGSNGVVGVQLRWQREMDFTDSGTYVCHASNNNGTDRATLELLVEIGPTIDSIYPSSATIEQDSPLTLSFTVPTDYVGRTLTCTANGWPIPVVEWQKNNVPLTSNNGIISEATTTSATTSARLTWTRGFQDSDAGSYQCVVYKANTAIPVTSQTVQLNSRLPTTISPTPPPCEVQEVSIHFQIRVFSTNCQSWGDVQRTEIASEFRDELQSVVTTECACTFDESDLQVTGPAECSRKVNGAAVFRGRIETSSQQDTKRIFCSLHSWQQKSPLVRINDQLRAVDSNCSLEAGSASDSEECVAPIDRSSVMGLTEIVAIAAGAGAGFVILMVVVLLLCCLGCCYCFRRKEGKYDPKDDHVYTRTESFSRYSRDTVGLPRNERHPQGIREEESLYSTLAREATSNQSPRHNQESIGLGITRSTSRENLIITDNVDGLTRALSRSRTQQTPEAYQIPINSRENLVSLGRLEDGVSVEMRSRTQQVPEAYQIPVCSQENLSSLGRLEDSVSVGKVQAGKRHVSCTSSYDSTSHLLNKMANPRPSNSSTDDAADYEEISGDDDTPHNSPTVPSRTHRRPSADIAHTYHQLTDSRKHSDARPPPTFFLGESSPQRGETRAELGHAVQTTSTQSPGSSQASTQPQHTSETTVVTPSIQQAYHIDNGSHMTDGSSRSSPHMTKQEFITQLQSVSHVQSHPRAAGNVLEPPPPYTSRPSSEAVEYTSESCGSSMVDNAAYEDVSRQLLPWYECSSDASLNLRTAASAREQIQPYAMINNEHIPNHRPSHGLSGRNLNTERSSELRSGNRQRRIAEFRVRSPEQQYSDERGGKIVATEV